MLVILRPGASGSDGHPAVLLIGLHCTQTEVAPAWAPTHGNATRGWSATIGPPTDPVGNCGIDAIIDQLDNRR
jgi:hypothetical protein